MMRGLAYDPKNEREKWTNATELSRFLTVLTRFHAINAANIFSRFREIFVQIPAIGVQILHLFPLL
jgi:hypothetical protein